MGKLFHLILEISNGQTKSVTCSFHPYLHLGGRNMWENFVALFLKFHIKLSSCLNRFATKTSWTSAEKSKPPEPLKCMFFSCFSQSLCFVIICMFFVCKICSIFVFLFGVTFLTAPNKRKL